MNSFLNFTLFLSQIIEIINIIIKNVNMSHKLTIVFIISLRLFQDKSVLYKITVVNNITAKLYKYGYQTSFSIPNE